MSAPELLSSSWRKLAGAVVGSLLIVSMTLLGTSCGGGGGDGCDVAAQKRFVLETVSDWYLFQDDLPSSISFGDYATAEDLLDALTANARAEHKDRFFSFITTEAAEQQFFEEGQAVAFGITTEITDDDRVFVTKVEPQSPTADAGFVRGDEILAIGPTPDALLPVSSMTPEQVNAAFGPAQQGVTRSFRVHPRDAADDVSVVRTMTKRLITLDPVPIAQILPGNIGYVALESFITPAEDQLRDAFATFKAQGVHDIIVDLRYDGGGLVSVAQLLASLLAAQHTGELMFNFEFNDRHEGENQPVPFTSESEAIAAEHIAFITTGSTASASELTINSLAPYADVAIIGAPTFGKPVGQSGFVMGDCGLVLRLITFRTTNSSGNTDYFTGLPNAGFEGDFCPADDDVQHDRADPAEDSTARAISWINTGVCPASRKALGEVRLPRSRRPTLLEDNRPGLF